MKKGRAGTMTHDYKRHDVTTLFAALNVVATLPQMNAIFGWTGSRMALHYIQAASRKRLAAEAIQKLNGPRTSIPAP